MKNNILYMFVKTFSSQKEVWLLYTINKIKNKVIKILTVLNISNKKTIIALK